MNYETGLLKSFSNKVTSEITFFAVNGKNLIVNVPFTGYINTGEISNKGIEFAMDAMLTKALTLQSTYSFIHMKNPVYATPEHHIYLNVIYAHARWLISGTVQQIINLDNDASNVVNEVSYTLVQAKVICRFTPNIKLYISTENLLDQTYAVNRYYTMPGTTFFAGLNLNF